MVDATSDEGESSEKVCEIAYTSVSFKSDTWKRFGFCASRKENRKKAMAGRKEYEDNAGLLHTETYC